MKTFYKRLKKIGIMVVAIVIFGIGSSSALVPLPVVDWPDLKEKAMQTLQETIMSELESQGNQILSKKLTDVGFGEMAGEVFGPVLGPLLANNPYMQQLQGSLGSLEDMAKDTAKSAGKCALDAKKARMDAIKKYKQECKEKNKEDEAEEKKCIEDAKDRVKKIEKDALALCKAEMNKQISEISAAAKQQAKEVGDSMKKDYDNAKAKAKDIKDDVSAKAKSVKKEVSSAAKSVKNSFSWKKKNKDKGNSDTKSEE